MIIFLIGFMGAGKSSVGKRLASKLKVPFLDSDREIEDFLGMDIPQIFETKGEAFFRNEEKKWLQSLTSKSAVIALGGGTPCQEGNMELINQLGISVYINMNVDLLTNRLLSSKGKRPLIEQFKDQPEALKNFIIQKLGEREPFYKQAKIQIAGDNINSEKLQRLIDIIKLPSSL